MSCYAFLADDLKISHIEKSSVGEDLINAFNSPWAIKHDTVIEIRTSFCLARDEHSFDTFTYTNGRTVYLWEWEVGQAMERLVADLLMAFEIAVPGALSSTDVVIFLNDKMLNSMPGISPVVCEAMEYAETTSWPPVAELDPMTVFTWLLSVDGFVEGLGVGQTGRSLAAFSRVVFSKHATEEMSLFWTMLGLEALYCESEPGVGKQLRRKVARVLGEPKQFKRRLSRMYNYRSRLVHGDIDIPYSYGVNDVNPQYESFLSNTGNSLDIAVAVLVATIQKLAEKNLKGLEFTLRWAGEEG